MDFGTAVWSSPVWQAAAVEWVDYRLAGAGIRRTGPVSHPHVRAWATAVRVPTDRGTYDLHPQNSFWAGSGAGSGQARFFDWGDAVLAHPFAAMLVPLGMVRRFLDEPLDGPGFLAVRNAYLDLFRDLAPAEDLPATLETACRVAKIARAHTWQRAIGAAAEQGDAAADRFRDAPLDTLGAVLDQDWLTVG